MPLSETEQLYSGRGLARARPPSDWSCSSFQNYESFQMRQLSSCKIAGMFTAMYTSHTGILVYIQYTGMYPCILIGLLVRKYVSILDGGVGLVVCRDGS